MNCPNCGKEIKENQKFCTNCGAKLKKNIDITQIIQTFKDIIKKPIFKYVLLSFIVCIVIIFCFLTIRPDEVSEYKSIIPVSRAEMDNMTALKALDLLIIQQDNDLTEYINKHSTRKIDNLFEVFYENLYAFAGSEVEFNSKLSDNEDEENAKNGIEYKYEQFSKDDESVGRIIKPKTDLFVMANNSEGGTEAIINYDYLIKYSSNLTQDWKDFLQLKQKEYRDWYGYTYYGDGYPPRQYIIINRYLDETAFIKKYPDFPMNNILQNNIKEYISNMQRLDILELIFEDDMKSGKANKLYDEEKQAYEKFLKEADKDTEEYRYIKKLYEIIKENDFKCTDILYKNLYDMTGNEYFNEIYNNIKKEQENRQAIKEYKNYKFDKEEAYLNYQNAFAYCSEEMKKLGWLEQGSGTFEYCLMDYFHEQEQHLSKLFDLVYKYCEATSECEADKRNCLINEFESFQNNE